MTPVLSLANVSLTFHRGSRHLVSVLAAVDLAVEAGEVVAVLAQRAQGKTSLLRVAAGMLRPNQGSVMLAGQDIWSLSARRRARLLADGIGWVGHAAPELDLPMLTSVALPLLGACGKQTAYERAAAALERVGARDCAEQRWESLADWERVLVSLAHGIAGDPRLLLVDDIAVSLGFDEADEATRLLDSLARERDLAVLMCASDAKATGWSSRVLTLFAGELLHSHAQPRARGNVIDFPPQAAWRASG
jgi:predicted ABC-type transport system involved in lysophospholipase L1 biosynthesis ATPase subunit